MRGLEYYLRRLGNPSKPTGRGSAPAVDLTAVSRRNPELMKGYTSWMRLSRTRLKENSLLLFARSLCAIAPFFPVDFDEATKDDLEGAVSRMQEMSWKPNTLCIRMHVLRNFFKWMKTGRLKRQNPWPDEVSWIELQGRKERTIPEGLLSPEDVRKMVESATSLMLSFLSPAP
jgi:site-specific recombinase XerD